LQGPTLIAGYEVFGGANVTEELVPELGADFGTDEYMSIISTKPLASIRAVSVARSFGMKTLIYNDGDITWTSDFRRAVPTAFELVTVQLEVEVVDGVIQGITGNTPPGFDNGARENGALAEYGDRFCTGVIVFNLESPQIDELMSKWNDQTIELARAGSTPINDQVAFEMTAGSGAATINPDDGSTDSSGLVPNPHGFRANVFSPLVVANGNLLDHDVWNRDQLVLQHANWVAGIENKIKKIKEWSTWMTGLGEEDEEVAGENGQDDVYQKEEGAGEEGEVGQ
jgi:hypothetical protein